MTKAERRKIYLDGAEYFSNWNYNKYYGFCQYAAWYRGLAPTPLRIITDAVLPEFSLFDPLVIDNAFWFPTNELRTLALLFCAEMCND